MSRQEIMAANPIVDFVRNRCHELKRVGQNFVTNGCPVTNHKCGHRPVMIYPETQSWACHDCKRGGSVIDWIMLEKNVTAVEAKQQLGGGPNGSSEIVAMYDYTDEAGKLLFQCVRFNPKGFRQRHPDGKGGWKWNLDGVRRVLYRLPELLRDLKRGWPVIVSEGEKDVDAVERLGLEAAVTCNPMGAGKWRDEYSETLRGARVFLIADKDKAGRDHAEQAAASLHGIAKRVAVLELPDHNGQSVKDSSDWITAGGNARELAGLLDAAPEWTPQTWNDNGQWPDPKRLPADLPTVPQFSFECLPDTLRPWIEDISERMQCPADFPAVGAMIALGSIVGRKIGIRPKRHDDWTEIPNLWGFVVGRPGVLKTPALQQSLVHVRRLVAEALTRYEIESCQHNIGDMLRGQRRKLVEDEIKKKLKANDEAGAGEEARKHLDGAIAKPVCRRYEIADSTTEKLGELLAENPNGLLLVRDEISGLLRSLDREECAGDRAKYLEMWDGKGELVYDRIGRGTVRIPSNTLSILGGIQPDVLMAYIREAVRGGPGNDGLLQRFQLSVWPDVSKKWRNVDRWPDTEAKNKAFSVFEYLDNLTAETVGADTADGIPFLRFADDAQESFNAWRAALERKLRSDTEHPAFEAHLAKYRKLVPALALLIHLAQRQTGPVSLGALNKALRWASFLEAHARRIYSAVLRSDLLAARELAKHLQRGDLPKRFTLRETYRKGWTGLATKEDAEAAAEILCDLGWIRPTADASNWVRGTSGRGGSPTFETNPRILEHAAEGTDKTDKINSVSSVSDQPGDSQNFSEPELETEVDAFVPDQTGTGKLRL
jgi:putative DNA primase/helicase